MVRPCCRYITQAFLGLLWLLFIGIDYFLLCLFTTKGRVRVALIRICIYISMVSTWIDTNYYAT